jgi:DNA-binding response OmpR family regulator
MRLLVIDDDPMQLELIDRALSRDGFQLCCVSAFDAVEAEARRFEPEIALVDVNMPDVDPARVFEVVRRASRARIVLYSAWEGSRLRALAKQFGADGFISKGESVFSIGQHLRELNRGDDGAK